MSAAAEMMSEGQGVPPHRRSTDGDTEFVDHVRAADTGLAMARRWIELLVILVGFGVTIGVLVTRLNAQTEAFADFKSEIRGRLDKTMNDASDASRDVKVLEKRFEEQQQKSAARDIELEQWRAVFQALKMAQSRGATTVNVQIPDKERTP